MKNIYAVRNVSLKNRILVIKQIDRSKCDAINLI